MLRGLPGGLKRERRAPRTRARLSLYFQHFWALTGAYGVGAFAHDELPPRVCVSVGRLAFRSSASCVVPSKVRTAELSV
jgi:hypothetical protein